MTLENDPLLSPIQESDVPDTEDFQALLESYERSQVSLQSGDIVEGSVLSITDNFVFLDIEYKSEGRIPLDQLKNEEWFDDLERGFRLEAVVENMEDDEGYILLSYEKISKKKLYEEIEKKFQHGETLRGRVISTVKGGLTVDVGVRAFLPGSQIDTMPVRNFTDFIGQDLEFKIIQYNARRRNIVVSHRAIIEARLARTREETIQKLVPDNVIEGVVKNVTDYGVFIDLGGIDGLLHKTDISWGRVQHPADFFRLWEKTSVIVLHYDKENQKVSLGYKQMEPDPWKNADQKYPPGSILEGTLSSLTSYGIFVEIEKGIEGLVHRTELSWDSSRKFPDPSMKPGTPFKVMVLSIDVQSRRLSLSIKRHQPNPWQQFAMTYRRGNIIDGIVRNANKFGLFIEVAPHIIGRVYPSDISWKRDIAESLDLYNPGDSVNTVILDFDPKKQRLTLGIKQLEEDIWDDYFSRHQVGDIVEGTISGLINFGAFVNLDQGIEGLCHISEFTDGIVQDPGDFFNPGQQVRMKIIKMNLAEKKISLSHRLRDLTGAGEEHVRESSNQQT
ncbi:MAG: 30S ribosomal protein S1 [Acidobacteria bacterium]|nr:30S ribosomal protein S1 [Acidobacteriota bacterium]